MSRCRVDDVIARVKGFAAQQGWTKSRFAREADINDTTLRKFNRDDWNPTANILRQLERVIPDDFEINDGGAV